MTVPFKIVANNDAPFVVRLTDAEMLAPYLVAAQAILDNVESITQGPQGEPGTWGDTSALDDAPTDISGLKLFGFDGTDPINQYGIPASRLILADANGNLALGTPTASNGLAEIKTTAVGAPATRGLVISHYADGVGSYGIDTRAYPGASTAQVIHVYSGFLEDGPNCGIGMQIDHTKSGAHLILKNDENPTTSPGTKGTASFLTLTGYGGASGTTRNTVFVEWTHENRILLQDVYHPLDFFGAGVKISGTTATIGPALDIAGAKVGQYSLNVTGKDNGVQIVTDTNGNNTVNIVKSGNLDGNVIRILNGGFGPMLKMDDGVGTQRAAIDKDGYYYVGADKVLGVRVTGWTAMTGTGSKSTIAASAAGTASASYTQAELQGALNRIAALEARLKSYDDALFAHGLIGT